MKRSIIVLILVVVIGGCAFPRPSNRVSILACPEGTSDDQRKADMKECDKKALNRLGARTGELLAILFCPPGIEGPIARGFDRRDDLHYKDCMEAKGYQLEELR